MKLFIDSADFSEIVTLLELEIFSGITTTPIFFKRLGIKNWRKTIRDITRQYDIEVHVEALGKSKEAIIEEALRNSDLGNSIVSKIPINVEGIKAASDLSNRGILTNLHLIFSLNQSIIASRTGTKYICPLIGRLNDIGVDGHEVLREIVDFFRVDPTIKTEVMASSIRSVGDVSRVALAGVGAVTIPPDIIKKLLSHPLTDSGISDFFEVQ
jgi:transaldolase